MDEKLCPSCEEPVVEKLPPCPLLCMSPKCKAYDNKPLINPKEKPIIWIIGGPGSGKGTQSVKIQEKYGYKHISCGDLLRAEVQSGSDMSKCLETVMARGGLVPNDIVVTIIKAAVAKLESTAKGFVIDGYPREVQQGVIFEKSFTPVTAILYFEVCRETMMARLKEHMRSSATVRFDDTDKAIRLRIKTFFENNQQILQKYNAKIHVIDAEKPIDEVFAQIVKVLDPIAVSAQNAISASGPTPAPIPPAPSVKP